MEKGTIYLIMNHVTGKYYVGRANKYAQRMHRYVKHGLENHTCNVICEAEDAVLDIMEAQYIKEYDAMGSGLNCTPGGRGNKHPSESTRALWSAQRIGNKHALGSHHTEEFKDSQRERMKGHKINLGRIPTEETRAKMGAAHKGNQCAKGTVWTDEMRAKLSEARKGNKNNAGNKANEETRRKMREAHQRRCADIRNGVRPAPDHSKRQQGKQYEDHSADVH